MQWSDDMPAKSYNQSLSNTIMQNALELNLSKKSI